MEATYTSDFTIDRNRLRFETGDVDMEDPILYDEELDFLLESGKSFESTILEAIDRIIVRLNNEVSTALGPSRVEAQQRRKHYADTREQLRVKYGAVSGKPYAGGISLSDKRNRASNNDWVQPMFTRGDTHGYKKPRP